MMKSMFDYATMSNAPVKLAQKHNNVITMIEDGVDDDLHCIVDNKYSKPVLVNSVKHIDSLLSHNELGTVYNLNSTLKDVTEDLVGDFENALEDASRWHDTPADELPNGALDSVANYHADIDTLKYWIDKYESNPDNIGVLINL